MAVQDIKRLDDRIDRVTAGATEISMGFGGVQFKTMIEIMEFAKLMAVSGAAVPHHLRGNPGACLAICTRALRFNFDPFALAEHSYLMVKNQKVGDKWESVETMAFDSFVIHAIIEAHAPITGRMRPRYSGEGDARKCVAYAIPKGERDPLEHESPTVGELKAARGKNDAGKIKGSPLWETKPDQQLWYDTRRDWCRKFYPEILLGWYDKDELEETVRAETALNVTPKPDIATRLKGGTGKRGFQADNVKQIEAQPSPPAVPMEPVKSESDAAETEAIIREAEELGDGVLADEAAREVEPEWLAQLRNCASVSAVDRLEKEIGATLTGDALAELVDACTARAAEIMAKKRK